MTNTITINNQEIKINSYNNFDLSKFDFTEIRDSGYVLLDDQQLSSKYREGLEPTGNYIGTALTGFRTDTKSPIPITERLYQGIITWTPRKVQYSSHINQGKKGYTISIIDSYDEPDVAFFKQSKVKELEIQTGLSEKELANWIIATYRF